MSQGAGILGSMNDLETPTYRNHHGDLCCAIHRKRMIVPPLPSRYARRYGGAKPQDPWCTDCRQEGSVSPGR